MQNIFLLDEHFEDKQYATFIANQTTESLALDLNKRKVVYRKFNPNKPDKISEEIEFTEDADGKSLPQYIELLKRLAGLAGFRF